MTCLAEAQLAGAECFADLEDIRADRAGAPLRAVANAPSSSTALQVAKRFRRSHLQRAERAAARAAAKLDEALGRDPSEDVTVDLDASGVEVFGLRKQGAARNRDGQLSYSPYLATWAQRGRALCSELYPGNRQMLGGTGAGARATAGALGFTGAGPRDRAGDRDRLTGVRAHGMGRRL